MASILCTVATPTRELFSGEIHYASVPSIEGSYGVLPGHEMLVALYTGGLLTLQIDEAGTDKREYLVFNGASEIIQDRLTVLGRYGIPVDEIKADEVSARASELRSTIADLEGKDNAQVAVDLEAYRKELEWCELELRTVGAQA